MGTEMNNSWFLLLRTSYGVGDPYVNEKWQMQEVKPWAAGCGEWEEGEPKQGGLVLPCLPMKFILQWSQSAGSLVHCCFLPLLFSLPEMFPPLICLLISSLSFRIQISIHFLWGSLRDSLYLSSCLIWSYNRSFVCFQDSFPPRWWTFKDLLHSFLYPQILAEYLLHCGSTINIYEFQRDNQAESWRRNRTRIFFFLNQRRAFQA